LSTLIKVNLTTNTNMNAKLAKVLSSRDITRKGAAKVAEIVRVGTEILLAEGFSSVTKRRVAKRLGMAHGNVGYYFPTRESLWHAVVYYELSELYKKYPVDLDANTDGPQSCFDEYLVGYFDECESGKSRSFYAHVEAFAEINSVVAGWRDEIYERILQGFTDRIRPLCVGVDDEQIKLRALTVMLLFEGLEAVSAFRPDLVKRGSEFRQQLIDQANTIVRGE